MHFLFLCLSLTLFAETFHQLDLPSGQIFYTAKVSSLPIPGDKGNIGYISYIKSGAVIPRPITFAFNGGPGSSSVWLHMGAFGPKRVVSPEEGGSIVPPYE